MYLSLQYNYILITNCLLKILKVETVFNILTLPRLWLNLNHVQNTYVFLQLGKIFKHKANNCN